MGAAFMDVKKATTLASITIMTFMLSGGFFLQVKLLKHVILQMRLKATGFQSMGLIYSSSFRKTIDDFWIVKDTNVCL